ncbi:MAG TPA: hypothetical protein QGF05_02875 [Dehalococcoidia bacterium]|nr:hypothetical protein [Dehalococcoidia bacterium]
MFRERADVSCLLCGRNLGQLERVDESMRLIEAPETPNAAQLVRKPSVGLACGRCGGRAMIGPMERVAAYAA